MWPNIFLEKGKLNSEKDKYFEEKFGIFTKKNIN